MPPPRVLEEFGVAYDLSVVSAHRTPARAGSLCKNAADRGLQVIIAGAGGAAHLAGVIAAYTELPVIGVPVLGKALDGADALYSTVQMPPGIPSRPWRSMARKTLASWQWRF